MRIALAILCLLVVARLGFAESPATHPATAAVEWGQAQAGLSVSLQCQRAVAGERLILRLQVRNESPDSISLAEATGFLLLVESREKAYYSEKIELAKEKTWPARLASGKTAQIVLDLSDRHALAFRKGLKIVEGYPAPAKDEAAPDAAGTFGALLPQASLMAQWMLTLPIEKPPLILKSNALTVQPDAPDLAKLSPEARKAWVADLLEQFRRNPFAAKSAHDKAVKAGGGILDELLAANADDSAPDFARMWLTTAIIDIGDARAVESLLKLLKSAKPDVQHVIAYHGPKLKSEKLNAAILARAEAGDDPTFTAWAARGQVTFGSTDPEKLIDIALRSKEPRARAEVADALAKRPQGKNVGRLLALLGDEDERVRAAAAKAIGSADLDSPAAVAALVAALEKPGDAARQAIVGVLMKFIGPSHPYAAEADEAQKQQTVKFWRDWWDAHRKDYQEKHQARTQPATGLR